MKPPPLPERPNRSTYVVGANDSMTSAQAVFMISNRLNGVEGVVLQVGIAGDPWHVLAFTPDEWDSLVDFFVQHRKGALT